MSGISGCIGCPSESPGWLGLSIMSDIEKKMKFLSSCARWGLFWSKRVDRRQIIYLSWTDQGVLNLGKDTWREIPHNAPLIRLLLSDQVVDELKQNELFVSSRFLGT